MTISLVCPLPSRGVIQVIGPDARDFLQNLITNDMARVSPDQAIYAALLTPQGKYLFDFFVAQWTGENGGGGGDGECFLLDCEAARRADLVKRLLFYKLRAKIDVGDLSQILGVTACLGHEGLQMAQLPERPGAARQLENGVAFTDPRHIGIGGRSIIPVAAIAGLGDTASAGEYDRLRLELGLPDGARDIQVEKYFLLEANFEELNGVDFKKGCYVGQELVSRMKHRDAVRKRIVPVRADGELPGSGTPILQAGREAGTLLSSRDGLALAYLRLAALSPDATPLTANGAELSPQIPAWLSGKLAFTVTGADDEN